MDLAVQSNQAKLNIIAVLISHILTGSKLHLAASNFTNDRTLTVSMLLAIEATFTGYAVQTVSTWGTPSIDVSNYAASLAATVSFTPTGIGGSGNLYGWFLLDPTDTYLVGAALFALGPINVPQSQPLAIPITYQHGSINSN